MALKSDAKFKEKLTCGFKYELRNLVKFQPTTQKPENLTSMGSFCPKYVRFGQKRIERLSFIILNSDVKLCFQKWHEKLGEHSLWSTKKSEMYVMYIDGLLLSKAYNVSVRKFQRNFVS